MISEIKIDLNGKRMYSILVNNNNSFLSIPSAWPEEPIM